MKQLYGNKMDNLEEMDRFLWKFNLPRLNQEEIEIMNNPNASTEIEAVLMRWMKLEPIIQSEVRQKEKHQYSILTHI